MAASHMEERILRRLRRDHVISLSIWCFFSLRVKISCQKENLCFMFQWLQVFIPLLVQQPVLLPEPSLRT